MNHPRFRSAAQLVSAPALCLLCRFETFKNGLRNIIQINEQPGLSFWAAPNQFTDMTWDEFRSEFLGTQVPPNVPQNGGQFGGPGRKLQQAPSSVDWVAQGKVSPIKSQGGVSGLPAPSCENSF